MLARLVTLLLVLALPAAALAAPARKRDGKQQRALTTAQLRAEPDLWATVNVCDTPDRPNVIGVRASMPGDGARLALYMRFQIQYLAPADGKWHNIDEGADSGFRRIGKTAAGVRESGWSFTFLPPPEGGSHILRGAVTFEWRDSRRARHRIRELTEAGHRSKAGADPKDFSAAQCEIK